MAKSRKYISLCPKNTPEWYWVNGLHDACIVGVEAFEFPFDYNKFVGKEKYNAQNLLVLKIDAEGALCDNSVEEIHFFNYKLLTPELSLENRKTIWWLADRLVEQDNCYILEADLQDLDSFPENFTFKIKFDRAEVKRKSS